MNLILLIIEISVFFECLKSVVYFPWQARIRTHHYWHRYGFSYKPDDSLKLIIHQLTIRQLIIRQKIFSFSNLRHKLDIIKLIKNIKAYSVFRMFLHSVRKNNLLKYFTTESMFEKKTLI